MYALENVFFLTQNEVANEKAANDLLMKACEAAVRTREDLKEKSTVAEVFT